MTTTEKLACIFGFLMIAALGIGWLASHPAPLSAADAADAAQQAQEQARSDLAMEGARGLEKMVRDPDSLEIASAVAMPDGGTVCYEYRARNGFGGMNEGNAILAAGSLYVETFEHFNKLWKVNCSGAGGTEEAQYANLALRADRSEREGK